VRAAKTCEREHSSPASAPPAEAGALLKEKHSDMEVLCILNVIGAGSKTTSQQGLNFPYVLVRDWELEMFYTAHFAPVARFIRQRHVIGEEMRKQREVSAEVNGDDS